MDFPPSFYEPGRLPDASRVHDRWQKPASYKRVGGLRNIADVGRPPLEVFFAFYAEVLGVSNSRSMSRNEVFRNRHSSADPLQAQ